MDLSGEQIIPLPPTRVFAALLDAEVLKASIPGCETLEKISDSEMRAVVVLKIGPIGAKFSGQVTLSDIDPPRGCTISGQGSGGAAGFAKGSAQVRIEEHPQGSRLTYSAKAQVGGKIAQLGARLIDATARKLADQFFQNFRAQIAPPAAETAEAAPPAPAAPPKAKISTTQKRIHAVAVVTALAIIAAAAAYPVFLLSPAVVVALAIIAVALPVIVAAAVYPAFLRSPAIVAALTILVAALALVAVFVALRLSE